MKLSKKYHYIAILGICVEILGSIIKQDLTIIAVTLVLIGLIGQIKYSDKKDRLKILIVGLVSAALLITIIIFIRL